MSGADRRGFATATALCLLAALAGMSSAAIHTVVQARRGATRSLWEQRGSSAAELRLAETVQRWNSRALDSLGVGEMDSLGFAAASEPAGGVRTRVDVIRLTNSLFWVTATAEVGADTKVDARRIHSLLVEMLPPTIPTGAAITSRGDVLLGGEVVVEGGDVVPPGWTDCGSVDTSETAAIAVPNGATVRRAAAGADPETRVTLAAGDTLTYRTFGAVSASLLAHRADLAIPAGAILSPGADSASNCQPGTAAADGGWGEPLRTGRIPSCEDYFPVIYAAGDLTVNSGRGQGMLLVAGRLRIQGPFLFRGAIIASGGMDVTGEDISIYGTVLSAAGTGMSLPAAGVVRRSTCAVARAAKAAARASVVSPRGWAEVF